MKKKITVFLASAMLTLGAANYAKAEQPKQDLEKYNQCIAQFNNHETPGMPYSADNFLMGFDNSYTKEEAEKIIEKYDYRDELELERYFDSIGVAVVKVKGNVEEHICYFKSIADTTEVYEAQPNWIIGLDDPFQ